MSEDEILAFLKELKYSYKDMDKVFMEGSCFRLYKILKTLNKDAEPWYSHSVGGHWITEIDNKFYDINGLIDYEYVKLKQFECCSHNNEMLESAYIPTYQGQCSHYDKYKRSH